ncbi:hypothetical protein B0H19DRAFT_1155211 [Mycena capillaripes]|nr:hypothetical protein B0H19DRAFT_1155211 [Mycena capillaripes]
MEVLRRWVSKADFVEQKDDEALQALTIHYFNLMPQAIGALSDDMFLSYSINFTRQAIFGCSPTFEDSPEYRAFGGAFNGRISDSSERTLGDTFGRSTKALLLRLAEGRITSAEDVIERLEWTPCGEVAQEVDESLYMLAFTRYLRGHGRVHHRLLPDDKLTDEERDIPDDDPLARSLLFLMHISGTPLLPAHNGKIEMAFHQSFPGPAVDPATADPGQNPEHWPSFICPVRQRSCFAGADLPLVHVTKLLKEPIPDDTTTSTDFDLYQYMMYRPMTRYAEFGGAV